MAGFIPRSARKVEDAPAGYVPRSARRVEEPPTWTAPDFDAQPSEPVAAQPVDPNALPAQLARPVGADETFAIRAADALPLGRPIVNTLAAMVGQTARAGGVGAPGARLGPASIAALQEQGLDVPEQPASQIGSFLEEYRRIRDERDIRGDVGSAHNKWAGRAGTGVGIAATALVPVANALKGPQSLGRSAGIAALLGGLQGTGDSRADLTRGEVGQQALDTGVGAAFGAVGGVLGHGMSKAAPYAFAKLRDYLTKGSMNAGRRALLGGADSLSGRIPVSDEAVKEAIDQGAIRLGGSTQGTSRRLDAARETVGDAYGSVLDALEAAGVRGPNAGQVAQQLRARGAEIAPTTIQPNVPRAFTTAADRVAAKGVVGVGDEAGTLGLRQAESIKRSAQDLANYARLAKQDKPLNLAQKEVASIIRRANEDAVEQAGQRMGGEVGELAESFVPLKTQLGRLIEASDAAERGAAAAGRRSGSSLTGTVLAAGRTGNAITDDALSRLLTLYRGRLPSTSAVLQSNAAKGAGALSRSSLERYLLGPSSAQGAIGAGSVLGDAVPLTQSEEGRSRYEALLRALQAE